jgi:hypothetical protein
MCSNCGELKPGAREVKDVEGELGELTADQSRFERLRRMNYGQLMRSKLSLGVARLRGYKSGWAWHRYREQQAAGAAV